MKEKELTIYGLTKDETLKLTEILVSHRKDYTVRFDENHFKDCGIEDYSVDFDLDGIGYIDENPGNSLPEGKS